MFDTWTLAVLGLMNSSSAIWRFVRPSLTRARTSISRRDRPCAAVVAAVGRAGAGRSSRERDLQAVTPGEARHLLR